MRIIAPICSKDLQQVPRSFWGKLELFKITREIITIRIVEI